MYTEAVVKVRSREGPSDEIKLHNFLQKKVSLLA